MLSAEKARTWIGGNLALLTFLGAYFLTTVLANLLYPFFGSTWAFGAIGHFTLADFPTASTFGYWLLLLLPFLLTPWIATATRSVLTRFSAAAARRLPEFETGHYAVILAIAYGAVMAAFWRADVATLFLRPHDAIESARMRFELLAALGYWPQAILKSVLMFLAVYSFIRALRFRRPAWIALALVNLLVMSALLALLNMKWPLLLLYVSLCLCVFLFSNLRLTKQVVVAALAMVAAYVGLTMFVMRLDTEGLRVHLLPQFFVVQAIDRMAVGYPYYFETFTREGPVCGTILDRVMRRKSPCQPSTLIYPKIFGDDGFTGTATQPAAVHIYGYALGGWPGALIELVLASLIVGAFISLPFRPDAGVMLQSIAVMGGLAGYFFSQLPVEGALIYDHGLLWWGLLVLAYAALRAGMAKAPA